MPTHDEGTFISWEFATDSFDIGFGLYFEWTHSKSTDMTVHVSRGNSDDEGETDEAEDVLKEEQPSRRFSPELGSSPLTERFLLTFSRSS